MHSQKTRALLKSINLLKKENQKIQAMNKNDARHRANERLTEDIKLQELAINALRTLLKQNNVDEDTQNIAIKRDLEAGPARIRVLSREELKIEVKKYKNLSLKIVEEFNKMKIKTPNFAKDLVKESTDKGLLPEGIKK